MTDIPNVQPDSREATIMDAPDKLVCVRDAFGIDSDMEVPAFSEADERVPDLDPSYVFDQDTTLAAAAYGGQPLAVLEAAGKLRIEGDRALAERFFTLFPLPAKASHDVAGRTPSL